MICRGVSSGTKRVLSSRYFAISMSSIVIKRSHKKVLNNKGPKIDPCDNPKKIAPQEL